MKRWQADKRGWWTAGGLVVWLLAGGSAWAQEAFYSFGPDQNPAALGLTGSARLDFDHGTNNRVARLTDAGQGSACGTMTLPNPAGNATVSNLLVRWRSLVGGGDGADGYSLNWATNLPSGCPLPVVAEEGAGTGLSVTVDTFDNGGGEIGLEIRHLGNRVVFDNIGGAGSALTFLRKNQFVDAVLRVTSAGAVTFNYDGRELSTTLPNWTGIARGRFMFAARTGGANDNHWVDDVGISVSTFMPGAYNGLFFEAAGIEHETGGMISLMVGARGRFSGKILLEGRTHPFTGAFNLTNRTAQVTVRRMGATTLTVNLSFADLENDLIIGTVSDGMWTSPLEADRQVWNKRTRPAEQYAGRFTTLLDNQNSFANEPGGYGPGTFVVDLAGSLKFLGRLSDGAMAMQDGSISKNGRVPLYFRLYGGRGSLMGWVDLDGGIPVLKWTKRSGVPGPLYRAGFETARRLFFGRYVRPPAGTRLLNLPLASPILFDGGNLRAPVVTHFALTYRNVVVDLGTNGLALTFDLPSGLFTGSFVDPVSRRRIPFRGAALQNETAGAGYFLGTNQSGLVLFPED